MQITIDLDIESAIKTALSHERLSPILDRAITSAVIQAVQDAVGYNAPFTKMLKAKVAEAMPCGLDLAEQTKFQHILNDAVGKSVIAAHMEAATAAIMKASQAALPGVPAEIHLSDLLKAARDHLLHSDGGDFFAQVVEGFTKGCRLIYIDEKPGTDRYRAAYHISISDDGSAYSVVMDRRPITPASRPDVISRFSSLLMALYVGRTRLLIDLDEDGVERIATGSDESDSD